MKEAADKLKGGQRMRGRGGLDAFKTKLLVFPPLLIALISVPMALGLVPPNRIYGLRTVKTLESADIWYGSNFWAGVIGVVLGILGAVLVYAIIRSRSMTDVTKAILTGA